MTTCDAFKEDCYIENVNRLSTLKAFQKFCIIQILQNNKNTTNPKKSDKEDAL